MFDPSVESDEELCSAVLAGELLARNAYAIRLRRLAALHERGVCDREHAATVGNWLATGTRLPHPACNREVTLAVKLTRHLPLVLDALEVGRISVEHVKAIARVANPRIIAGLAAIQEHLIDTAPPQPHVAWYRDLRTLADQLDVDGGHDPDKSDKIGLNVTRNYDGTYAVNGTLTQADGLAFRTELERLTEELFNADEDKASAEGEGSKPLPDHLYRIRSRCRAAAAGEMARRSAAREATDLKPPRPEVIVLYELSSGAACTTDGTPLRPDTLARYLPDVVWRRMWTGDGVPLDLGRRTRHATADQKLALAIRDGPLCVWPNCPNRPRHAHHHEEWDRDDGETDLENLVPLCAYHHGINHRLGWRRTQHPDHTITWTSPTGRTFTSRRHTPIPLPAAS